MDTKSEKLFSEREKRIRDAIDLKQPDRVPFAPFCSFFAVTHAGFGSVHPMGRPSDRFALRVGRYRQTGTRRW